MDSVQEVETDEERIRQAIWQVSRPRGIGEPRLEFGPDHSGDASAYVLFPITEAVRLTSKRVQQLVTFSRAIRGSLYELGTGMLFYVRYEDSAR